MLQLPSRTRRDFLYLTTAGALYMCSASFTLLLPRYLTHIGASPQETGWLIGLPVPFYILVTLFSGWLADRMPVRWLGLLGILLSAGSSWAMVLQDSVDTWVWILRAIQGVGHAFTLTPIVTMASRSLDVENRAHGMGYFAVSMQLGNIVGTLMAALLIESVGFSWYFGAALIFACVSAAALTRVGSTADAPARGPDSVVSSAEGGRRIIPGLIMMLVLGGAFGMVLQYSPLMLDHFAATAQLDKPLSASWILTTLLAAVIAVRLLIPKSVYASGGEPWLLLCMIGFPAALLLFPGINGTLSAVAVASLLGICYGALLPMAHALCLNRAGPARQGWAVSLTNLTYESGYRGFGFVIGPVVAAFGYMGMFTALALIAFLGGVVFLALEPNPRRWFGLPPARAASSTVKDPTLEESGRD